jgi:large subunit ribosomal protein L35e
VGPYLKNKNKGPGGLADNAAMAKIKAQTIPLKKEELLKWLGDLKVELSQLHISKVTGSSPRCKLSKNPLPRFSLPLIRFIKKTSGNSKPQCKRYRPLDLWPKKTGTLCYQLNKHKEQARGESEDQKAAPVTSVSVCGQGLIPTTTMKHETVKINK